MKFNEMYKLIVEDDVQLHKASPLTVSNPQNKTVKREDISNLLFQLTNGGRDLFTLWTRRKRDKKVNGQIVAKAGDVVEANGKLGRCNKDDKGIGSPLGNPQQRYEKYSLITMCCKREGQFVTRHFDASEIFKFVIGGTTYTVIE